MKTAEIIQGHEKRIRDIEALESRLVPQRDAEIKSMNEKLSQFEKILIGDGNGNKGMIRRMDGYETNQKFLKRISLVIFATQLALIGTVIAAILTK